MKQSGPIVIFFRLCIPITFIAFKELEKSYLDQQVGSDGAIELLHPLLSCFHFFSKTSSYLLVL